MKPLGFDRRGPTLLWAVLCIGFILSLAVTGIASVRL